ncbi:MAG: hypothetical protein ACI85Q_001293 [Salibacteraceae bacterium]|jgi:hypothetical protein
MAYQPVQDVAIQQHTSDLNLMGKVKNSRTSIGGGARFEKTYTNDYEDAAEYFGLWLSMSYQ